MGTFTAKNAPVLIDTGNAPEIFCSGVARFEMLPGGNIRAIVYSEQEDDAGNPEHVVVLRIIVHKSHLPRIIRQTTGAMTGAVAKHLLAGAH